MQPTNTPAHTDLHLNRSGYGAMQLAGPHVFGPDRSSIADSLGTVVRLQEEGLVKHIGRSNVDAAQIAEGRQIAQIVCVQNMYNNKKKLAYWK